MEAIEKHPCLKCLDLENNTLGPDAAKVMGDALAKHPEFERAHFKDLFTGRLKTEIPLALVRYFFLNKNLTRIMVTVTMLQPQKTVVNNVSTPFHCRFIQQKICFLYFMIEAK